jgi:regulator of sigma E protease
MQDVAMGGANPVPLQLRRDGQDMTVTLVPEMNDRFGVAFSGIGYEAEVEVYSVMPGKPAGAAGLKAGDRILTVDGIKVPSASALVEMVNGSKGRPLDIEIGRKGEKSHVQITPVMDPENKRFIIGIFPIPALPTVLVKRGPGEAFQKSVETNWGYATVVFRTLKGIFSGNIKPKALSGPIGIMQMIATSLRQGIQKLLEFMALLNTNLAVFNLLPLAITDGGVILFLLLEAIRRKPLALSTQNIINRVGFSFFLMLFLFVTFQDIIRVSWFLN